MKKPDVFATTVKETFTQGMTIKRGVVGTTQEDFAWRSLMMEVGQMVLEHVGTGMARIEVTRGRDPSYRSYGGQDIWVAVAVEKLDDSST
jgi:hypothetical protein